MRASVQLNSAAGPHDHAAGRGHGRPSTSAERSQVHHAVRAGLPQAKATNSARTMAMDLCQQGCLCQRNVQRNMHKASAKFLLICLNNNRVVKSAACTASLITKMQGSSLPVHRSCRAVLHGLLWVLVIEAALAADSSTGRCTAAPKSIKKNHSFQPALKTRV